MGLARRERPKMNAKTALDFQSDEDLAPAGTHRAPSRRDMFGELCGIESLHLACADLKTNAVNFKIDPQTLETIEGEGLDAFLQRLSENLRSGAYVPEKLGHLALAKAPPHQRALDSVRDLVVETGLRLL